MIKQLSLLQGTLDMLILKAVSLGPQHGYGVLLRIQQLAKGSLQIEQGSLYPALCRLEHQGFIQSKWGESEHNRKAKFYQLTAAGRKQLRFETENWNRLTDVMAAHFERCAGRHMNLVARIRSLLEGLLQPPTSGRVHAG